MHAFEWDQGGSAGVLVNMSVWASVEVPLDEVFQYPDGEAGPR